MLTMDEYKCGDCIHADACEEAETLTGFSRDNPAYCGMFLNAADVVPVRHGYWRPILHKDGKTDYECSCCLGIIMDVPDDDEHDLCAWCSMCGAKMDGGETDA